MNTFTARLAKIDQKRTSAQFNALCVQFENDSVDLGASQEYTNAGVAIIRNAQLSGIENLDLEIVHIRTQAQFLNSAREQK